MGSEWRRSDGKLTVLLPPLNERGITLLVHFLACPGISFKLLIVVWYQAAIILMSPVLPGVMWRVRRQMILLPWKAHPKKCLKKFSDSIFHPNRAKISLPTVFRFSWILHNIFIWNHFISKVLKLPPNHSFHLASILSILHGLGAEIWDGVLESGSDRFTIFISTSAAATAAWELESLRI